MRLGFVLVLLAMALYSKDSTVDCNEIFDLRKKEIARDIELLEQKEQSIEALKVANEELIAKKEFNLRKKYDEVEAKLLEANRVKKAALELYEKDKKVLEDIKKAKNEKLSNAYLKMKDSKAATILDQMSQEKAAIILSHLTAKKISKIMAKMNPANASEITKILSKDMKLDTNSTK
jgi:flagellar motility protein MotE (MotC chaperone)